MSTEAKNEARLARQLAGIATARANLDAAIHAYEVSAKRKGIRLCAACRLPMSDYDHSMHCDRGECPGGR